MTTVLRAEQTLEADKPPRGLSWVLLAAAVYLGAYAVGLMLNLEGRPAQIQSDLIYNIPALIATALVVGAARRENVRRRRIGWYLICAFLVLSQVADWMYPVYDLVLEKDIPFPGPNDAFYYLGYAALAPAIPMLVFPDSTLRDRRWVLDALIVTVVAGTLSLALVIEPTVTSGDLDLPGVVTFGYPAMDLGILTLLSVAIFASRGVFMRRTLVIAASVIALVIADTGQAFLSTAFDYAPPSNPMELGWLLNYWLLAVAALMPSSSEDVTAFEPSQSLVGLAMPYLAIVPVAAVLVGESITSTPSLELVVGSLLAIVLVTVRQYMTLSTNLAVFQGERSGLEAKLAQAAMLDPLTGVLNRTKFGDVLDTALDPTVESPGRWALVVVDLDDFAAINASAGYAAGDAFLRAHADTLKTQLRDTDVLARLHGDVFAILLRDVDSRRARAISQRLIERVRSISLHLDGKKIVATASAGIAHANGSKNNSELLSAATVAVQQAKAKGGNKVYTYRNAGRSQPVDSTRQYWRQRILDALDCDGFELYAQPICSLSTGEVERYEVLIRMNDPEGPLLPGVFLPVAEETGLMPAIDNWVIRHSLDILMSRAARKSGVRLAVNLSATALRDRELEGMIARALTSGRMARGSLVLEITESVAIADMAVARRFVDRLSRLGCQFALDDFGAGYSSFNHLKQLSIEHLKIDGGFIKKLPHSLLDQHLVQAMVRMARALNRRTIAEFVGDDETVALLREFGVDSGQGFHLGRPSPLLDVPGLRPSATVEIRTPEPVLV